MTFKTIMTAALTVAALAGIVPVVTQGGKAMAGPSQGFNSVAVRNITTAIEAATRNVSHYEAASLGTSREDALLTISPIIGMEESRDRITPAVDVAQRTGKAQIISSKASDPNTREGFEYGVLVRPDGSGLLVVREHVGRQPLGDFALREKSALLQSQGLAPLVSGQPGFHTIYAAELGANGSVKPLANPAKTDLRSFGISDPQVQPLPPGPVEAPATKPRPTFAPGARI